jgi:hypothetical protein
VDAHRAGHDLLAGAVPGSRPARERHGGGCRRRSGFHSRPGCACPGRRRRWSPPRAVRPAWEGRTVLSGPGPHTGGT